MSALSSLQIEFQNYLIENSQDVSNKITEPPQGNIEERLSIYGDGYYIRLIEALEMDFSAIKEYLGNNKFNKIAHDYLKLYPSIYYDVNAIGERFSLYFKNQNEEFLAELADFEWQCSQCITEKNSDILTIEDMQKIPQENWPELKFSFVFSLRQFQCQYNTVYICEAENRKKKPPKLKKENAVTYWIIWRKNDEAYYLKISEIENEVINAIKNQNNFAEICELLCAYMPEEDVVNYIVNLLMVWIQEKIFA